MNGFQLERSQFGVSPVTAHGVDDFGQTELGGRIHPELSLMLVTNGRLVQ
jgi:hypothetical protein